MKLTHENELNRIATIFKALADPNRLLIFSTIMTGDTCNCELKDNLGLAPNLLSHHLKVLEKAGLVNSRRDVVDGRWVYYAVNRENITDWHGWFASFFDPARIQTRRPCGPEGQLTSERENLKLK